MKKRSIVITTFLIMLGASLYLYAQYPFHIKGVSRNILESISPDGKYKLIDYTLEITPHAWFFYDHGLGFSKVYDVKTGKCLGTSRIYDMDYIGPLHWPSPELPYVRPAQNIKIPVPVE